MILTLHFTIEINGITQVYRIDDKLTVIDILHRILRALQG